MTRCFLNAGFSNPIGTDVLYELSLRGWTGVRQDVPAAVTVAAIVPELVTVGMGAILVLGPEVWHSPMEVRKVVAGCRALGLRDVAYEVGNELDNMDPRVYAQALYSAERAAREVDAGVRVMTAGTRNVSQDAVRWLAQVIGTGLVSDLAMVAVHTYRGQHDPDEPLPGYSSRLHEWSEVARAAGGRRWCLTEIGWTTARTSWWPCVRPLSEGQVAQYLRREVQIAAQAGCEYAVAYQLQDGAGRGPLDHFGIRRRDGTWKPSADVARGAV